MRVRFVGIIHTDAGSMRMSRGTWVVGLLIKGRRRWYGRMMLMLCSSTVRRGRIIIFVLVPRRIMSGTRWCGRRRRMTQTTTGTTSWRRQSIIQPWGILVHAYSERLTLRSGTSVRCGRGVILSRLLMMRMRRSRRSTSVIPCIIFLRWVIRSIAVGGRVSSIPWIVVTMDRRNDVTLG